MSRSISWTDFQYVDAMDEQYAIPSRQHTHILKAIASSTIIYYAAHSTIPLVVTASDTQSNLTISKQFILEVIDLDLPPVVVSLTTTVIYENVTTHDHIAFINVFDPDSPPSPSSTPSPTPSSTPSSTPYVLCQIVWQKFQDVELVVYRDHSIHVSIDHVSNIRSVSRTMTIGNML